jgi:glycosyltransferase involved in cell wall biosynthesis
MKVALVHDYIREYGGAERVLRVLADMYPEAPIYTAFRIKGSSFDKELSDRVIHESFLAPLLKIWKLYSPLRFLTPLVWWSFDLSEYDLVITSAAWYISRGFRVGENTKVICYCHTPPRWLYGFVTSGEYQKYWFVRVYALIVGWFMREYDLWTASTVDHWIANSKNVQGRIKRFYKRDSTVIYPPIEVRRIIKATRGLKKQNYFLIVSRLVGAKGLEEAVSTANKLGFNLKIVGEAADVSGLKKRIEKVKGASVELLGRVSDKKLYEIYGKAKSFFALARDEDFGMTAVEAQAAGTAIIAFNGGGFKESVTDGETGILIDDTDEKTISKAIKRFNRIKWDGEKLRKNAMRFGKERFVKEMTEFVNKNVVGG